MGFDQGNFQIDGVTQAHTKGPLIPLQNVKVAVLIGAGTASSGEGVAYAFKERKNSVLLHS